MMNDIIRDKISKFIRKYPLLYNIIKLVCKKLYYLPLFHIILDPPTIIKSKWKSKIKDTQINRFKPLFLDRQSEIRGFFSISSFNLIKHYLKYGFPNTNKFKNHYIEYFEGNTKPNKLKKAYDNTTFNYTLRLMLAYERYSMMIDYLDFIIKDSDKKLNNFKILDYGCGVSDIGLLFASFGSEVTICDLDNLKFDFTVWRFRKRGFNPKIIKVDDTEVYPNLPELEYDLIIATEIFEHVRNPLKLLKNLTKSLKSGGYLFDSMGGEFIRDNRPHHLKEAFEIGQSDKYKKYYNKNYIHIFVGKGLNYLFKKKY